ncbi:MAG: flagellar export chaperone FliS [Myxococcota bacterium]
MSFALAQYRSARTVTASPTRVLVQLYDAALRYLATGVQAIETRDAKSKGISLGKAHRIVSELQASLDENHAPELCEQLYHLYDFCLIRISRGNAQWDGAAVGEAAGVLRELRSAWAEIAEAQG